MIDLKPCKCGKMPEAEDHRIRWIVRCECGNLIIGPLSPEPECDLPYEYWDAFYLAAIIKWNYYIREYITPV